jgi:hypothetical protein
VLIEAQVGSKGMRVSEQITDTKQKTQENVSELIADVLVFTGRISVN